MVKSQEFPATFSKTPAREANAKAVSYWHYNQRVLTLAKARNPPRQKKPIVGAYGHGRGNKHINPESYP
jgi:hypothetical protein